jgi:hypothetical protein
MHLTCKHQKAGERRWESSKPDRSADLLQRSLDGSILRVKPARRLADLFDAFFLPGLVGAAGDKNQPLRG